VDNRMNGERWVEKKEKDVFARKAVSQVRKRNEISDSKSSRTHSRSSKASVSSIRRKGWLRTGGRKARRSGMSYLAESFQPASFHPPRNFRFAL